MPLADAWIAGGDTTQLDIIGLPVPPRSTAASQLGPLDDVHMTMKKSMVEGKKP